MGRSQFLNSGALSAEERVPVNQTIRVAVAYRPRLMRELLLVTISDQPDIELVAEILDEADIPRLVEETAPEFLIIAFDSPDRRPLLCDSLFRLRPGVKQRALVSI